jgi:predicted alpha/beta-hydrolase family hydrolase
LKRFECELVKGWLHEPSEPEAAAPGGIAITHGAGSDCEAPLLKAMAEALAATGLWVLRFDLPYRQERRHGPPFPAQAARDREGLRQGAKALREIVKGPVFLGGHSYGGRQASMLAAEDPTVADALLLLSYPLHPPRKPRQLRVAHFPELRTRALFVHGTRDPFGSIEELRESLRGIPAHTDLVTVEGAPHGLPPSAAGIAAARFHEFARAEDLA